MGFFSDALEGIGSALGFGAGASAGGAAGGAAGAVGGAKVGSYVGGGIDKAVTSIFNPVRSTGVPFSITNDRPSGIQGPLNEGGSFFDNMREDGTSKNDSLGTSAGKIFGSFIAAPKQPPKPATTVKAVPSVVQTSTQTTDVNVNPNIVVESSNLNSVVEPDKSGIWNQAPQAGSSNKDMILIAAMIGILIWKK